jgi:hypothetical protein
VDTEHGFCGNLKAILAGFRQIFRAALTPALSLGERVKGEGIGGKRGAAAETHNAGGENAGQFAEPLVAGLCGGIVVRSHGTSSWKRPQRPSPGDRPTVWQEAFVYL